MISMQQSNINKQQPVSNINPQQKNLADNQQTPSRSPRTHRIFKEGSPRQSRNQSVSPPPKMMASQTTFDPGSASRHMNQLGCTMYYNQGIGLSRTATSQSLLNSMSPQKMRLAKSTQILEYQNSLLLKQLQQRDDVIHMYKSGWAPHNQPINDGVVKNLNLQLTQKNVLIEQVHRNLAQFQQIIRKDNVQVSPVCMERFKVLQELVLKHDHYPILIRERIVDTSRSAEKIIIREESHVRQWQIKLEHSYRQLNTIRDRLAWFQRQNNILQSTIAGLKVQKGDGTNQKQLNALRVQIQKFNNQIIIFEQQISNYKLQIINLNSSIKDLHAHYQRQINENKGNDNQAQINALKNQINGMQNSISKYELEVKSLTQIIQKYRFQSKNNAERQSQLLREIQQLKKIPSKQFDNSLQWESKIASINKNFGFRINQLEKEINTLKLKISQVEKEKKINLDETQKWKKHLQQAQLYISQLLEEITGYKIQIQKHVKQLGLAQGLTEQNAKLSTQILNLKSAIDKVKAESERLMAEIRQLNANGQQYRIQINQYSLKIQTLTKQRDDQSLKWQGIINSNNSQNAAKIRQLQYQIEELKKQINLTDKNKGRQWQDKYNSLKRQTDSFIDQLKLQIQNLKRQIDDICQKKENQSKISQQNILKIRQQYQLTIKNLRNQMDNFKNQLNTLNNNKADENRKNQQKINKIKFEYQQKVRMLTIQIQEFRLKIRSQKSDKDWERQMEQLKRNYEQQLKDLWQKLTKAERYIETMTQQSRAKITELQKIIVELRIQIEKLRQQKNSDQYLYKIDARYEEIRKKLITLSSKNNQAINSQSQFWQAYRQKRKKELEDMQLTINQSLQIMGQIEQTVIIRKTELHRLDLTKLQQIVSEINKIKNNKKQLKGEVREQIETKFYGLLKSVSTQISQ